MDLVQRKEHKVVDNQQGTLNLLTISQTPYPYRHVLTSSLPSNPPQAANGFCFSVEPRLKHIDWMNGYKNKKNIWLLKLFNSNQDPSRIIMLMKTTEGLEPLIF